MSEIRISTLREESWLTWWNHDTVDAIANNVTLSEAIMQLVNKGLSHE